MPKESFDKPRTKEEILQDKKREGSETIKGFSEFIGDVENYIKKKNENRYSSAQLEDISIDMKEKEAAVLIEEKSWTAAGPHRGTEWEKIIKTYRESGRPSVLRLEKVRTNARAEADATSLWYSEIKEIGYQKGKDVDQELEKVRRKLTEEIFPNVMELQKLEKESERLEKEFKETVGQFKKLILQKDKTVIKFQNPENPKEIHCWKVPEGEEICIRNEAKERGESFSLFRDLTPTIVIRHEAYPGSGYKRLTPISLNLDDVFATEESR